MGVSSMKDGRQRILAVYIEWENDSQKLHSRLCDSILHRAVPIDTILEVNEMLFRAWKGNHGRNKVHEDVNTGDDEETDDETENSSDEQDIGVE